MLVGAFDDVQGKILELEMRTNITLCGSTRPPSPDCQLQGADFRQLWKGLEETSSATVPFRKSRNSQRAAAETTRIVQGNCFAFEMGGSAKVTERA